MDADSPRFNAFRQANPGPQAEVLIGSRGVSVSQNERIAQGLATDDLACSGPLHEGTQDCALVRSLADFWRDVHS